MDITNQNFINELPGICKTINECNFIAIDTELSGLLRERSENKFDSPEDRFTNAVASSRGYFIMQFGLSCFNKIAGDTYSNKTYNFYIFPQPHKSYGDVNRTFSLQAHAIQFLTEHNFDFNKVFKRGVSYMTFEENKQLQAKLKNDARNRAEVVFKNGVPSFVPTSMISFCRDSIRKVEEFIANAKITKAKRDSQTRKDQSNGKNLYEGDPNSETKSDDCDSDSRIFPTMEIRNCGSNHKRNILRQVLDQCPFGDQIDVDVITDPSTNESYLLVEYLGKDMKQERQKKAIMNAIGFLKVIECIILNKKPLVGHNLLLDLVQIINQFIEELGDDYHSFKETCHSLFPLIFDTKYIAHSVLDPKTLTQNQSRLNDLYSQLKTSEVSSKIAILHNKPSYDDNQRPHEAGYDAYMSGFCFIILCEQYLKGKNKIGAILNNEPSLSVAQRSEIVSEFANRIYLSYSYDYKCYNLSCDEEEPDRSHVFYLEFPNNWRLDDIFHVFGQLGGVEACRLNKMSALCALKDKEQVNATKQKAKKLKESNSNYKLYTYDEYVDNVKAKPMRVVDKSNDDDDMDVSDA